MPINNKRTAYKRKLILRDFADLLGTQATQMPPRCRKLIQELDFSYRILKGEERDALILRVIKTMDSDLEISGPQRNKRWESGWSENLEEFIETHYDFSKLVPKFIKRNEVKRLRGQYIFPHHADFEMNFVAVLRAWLFSTYFSSVDPVYEFGCGTAHNLVDLAGMFPDKSLVGLDWAQSSLKIIDALAENCRMNISGVHFDMFHPDPAVVLREDCGVLTVGALEQMGNRFEPFLQYLIQNRPKVCVHIETLEELYDSAKLFDHLALRYIYKRHYLTGFLTRLKQLEREKRIKIIQTNRVFGSLFHEVYSFVIWKCL